MAIATNAIHLNLKEFAKTEVTRTNVASIFPDCRTELEEVFSALRYKRRFIDYVVNTTCWGNNGKTLEGAFQEKDITRNVCFQFPFIGRISMEVEFKARLFRQADIQTKRVTYRLEVIPKGLPWFAKFSEMTIKTTAEICQDPFENKLPKLVTRFSNCY